MELDATTLTRRQTTWVRLYLLTQVGTNAYALYLYWRCGFWHLLFAAMEHPDGKVIDLLTACVGSVLFPLALLAMAACLATSKLNASLAAAGGCIVSNFIGAMMLEHACILVYQLRPGEAPTVTIFLRATNTIEVPETLVAGWRTLRVLVALGTAGLVALKFSGAIGGSTEPGPEVRRHADDLHRP